MIDHFALETHALLNATKGYGPAIPDKSTRRHINRIASFIACQHNNPFVDHTFPQLLAIDFAQATLRWLEDPENKTRIVEFIQARFDLLQSLAGDADD